VALSEIDRTLLERCLARKPRAWEDFVDRFTGLVIHVVNHTARCRSIMLSAADREDLTSDVMMAIVRDDFAALRHFRGQSSLATYLTVIARRVVVRKMVETRSATPLSTAVETVAAGDGVVEQRLTDRDEVEQLLDHLDGSEAVVVRMYHLEGKTYQEIGRTTGMPTNSIGPMLSRARAKMRDAAARQTPA
jgi:RNA polymerase sigma-70 factor (ECF subfamily)